MAKGLKQSTLDELSNLPTSTTCKIERGIREASAGELVRIAKALSVTMDSLVSSSSSFVYQEEIKVIEALREIPFAEYKRTLNRLEADVYYLAKDAKGTHKERLNELVTFLISLAQNDQRPRSHISDSKRIRE